jgi:hypothetical protein
MLYLCWEMYMMGTPGICTIHGSSRGAGARYENLSRHMVGLPGNGNTLLQLWLAQ